MDDTRYRIGWADHGKWRYITVSTKADMIAEVADKTILSDKVSVKVLHGVALDKYHAYTLMDEEGHVVCYKATCAENAISRAVRTFGGEWHVEIAE